MFPINVIIKTKPMKYTNGVNIGNITLPKTNDTPAIILSNTNEITDPIYII